MSVQQSLCYCPNGLEGLWYHQQEIQPPALIYFFFISFNLQRDLFKFQFQGFLPFFLANKYVCHVCLYPWGQSRQNFYRPAGPEGISGHPSNTRLVQSSLPNQCYIYSAARHDRTQVSDGKSI